MKDVFKEIYEGLKEIGSPSTWMSVFLTGIILGFSLWAYFLLVF
jgi:hypothetical protein